MLKQCRWCLAVRNGEIAMMEHERTEHPNEYYLARAESLERRAERDLDTAKMFREKANLIK